MHGESSVKPVQDLRTISSENTVLFLIMSHGSKINYVYLGDMEKYSRKSNICNWVMWKIILESLNFMFEVRLLTLHTKVEKRGCSHLKSN